MEGRAVHIEGMKFLCESGNHSIVLDDGSTSITPVQALLLSMATCTAMDVWNIMVKKRVLHPEMMCSRHIIKAILG